MKGPAARVQAPTARRAPARAQRTPDTSPLAPAAALIQKAAGNRAVSSFMSREGSTPAHVPQDDVRRAISGPGHGLAGEILNRLETSFGRSLGHIRLHTDARAQDSARALEANAYAVGNHIVFAPGAYDPASPGGRRLIAHEVAHTLQQEGALPDPLDALRVSRPGERGEQAAEMAASAAMAGLPVPVVVREAVGIYRDATPKPQAADTKPKTPGWNETILNNLIQGKYAFQGDYQATKPGKFESFVSPDLNVALQFYTTEWQPGSGQEKTPQQQQIEAYQQKTAAAQEKKLAEQKANRERKLEVSETEQVAKLERSIALSERKKEMARREWEPRIQRETNPERKAMFQRFLDLRIRLAGVPFYPEEIWERYKAKKADEDESTTSHMEEFRAQRLTRASKSGCQKLRNARPASRNSAQKFRSWNRTFRMPRLPMRRHWTNAISFRPSKNPSGWPKTWTIRWRRPE